MEGNEKYRNIGAWLILCGCQTLLLMLCAESLSGFGGVFRGVAGGCPTMPTRGQRGGVLHESWRSVQFRHMELTRTQVEVPFVGALFRQLRLTAVVTHCGSRARLTGRQESHARDPGSHVGSAVPSVEGDHWVAHHD
jgi:hypothetical protein